MVLRAGPPPIDEQHRTDYYMLGLTLCLGRVGRKSTRVSLLGVSCRSADRSRVALLVPRAVLLVPRAAPRRRTDVPIIRPRE